MLHTVAGLPKLQLGRKPLVGRGGGLVQHAKNVCEDALVGVHLLAQFDAHAALLDLGCCWPRLAARPGARLGRAFSRNRTSAVSRENSHHCVLVQHHKGKLSGMLAICAFSARQLACSALRVSFFSIQAACSALTRKKPADACSACEGKLQRVCGTSWLDCSALWVGLFSIPGGLFIPWAGRPEN